MFSRHLIFKFYLWILLAIVVSEAGAFGVVILHSFLRQDSHIRSWALSEVAVARDVAAKFLEAGIAGRTVKEIFSPLTRHTPVSLVILGPDGEELAAIMEEGMDVSRAVFPTAAEIFTIRNEGELLSFHREDRFAAGLPILLPSGEEGVFFVTLLKGGRWRRDGWHWEILTGLGVFLIVLLLLSWPLANHMARPLRKMASAATALGKGDLSVRIPIQRRDEIGQLADSFNSMAENLQVLVGGHKQLLADISHEMRSPLARLRIAMELARQEGGPASEEPLDRVERQADAMEALIDELLTYSRLDSAPYTRRDEKLSLAEVLAGVTAAHGGEAGARDVKLQVEVSPGAEEVIADRTLLSRALGNVIGNGIAHAPAGTALRIVVETGKGTARISVSDEGPGVEEEMLESIFQPFVRADSARSRATGGVGLGLAIARRCMEAHGGGASAEPGPGGKGLSIVLWLPLQPAPDG